MTGPCTAIDPRTAKRYSTGLEVWKARWVSMRWKPIVTPKPVSRYMSASTPSSVQPTTWFQKRITAAQKATKGTITAPMFEMRAVRVMALEATAGFHARFARSPREVVPFLLLEHNCGKPATGARCGAAADAGGPRAADDRRDRPR